VTTRIKVCCIASVAEAALAVRHGASALGLVSAMPSGPGPIPEHEIPAIVATVPPGVATFLLTAHIDADAIIDQQRRCRANTLQLVDAVQPHVYGKLRRNLPGVAIVQVIHVRGNDSAGEALDVAPHVDALLLDSGNPTLAVKELGGTGRTHDWAISRYIVERAGKPVYLAGGLTPENVGEAIATVRPFGVDLCTGIRTDRALDDAKLARFAAAVAAADAR
jgi:phosphoribosylanthranilate isomerase